MKQCVAKDNYYSIVCNSKWLEIPKSSSIGDYLHKLWYIYVIEDNVATEANNEKALLWNSL